MLLGGKEEGSRKQVWLAHSTQNRGPALSEFHLSLGSQTTPSLSLLPLLFLKALCLTPSAVHWTGYMGGVLVPVTKAQNVFKSQPPRARDEVRCYPESHWRAFRVLPLEIASWQSHKAKW